MCIDWLRLKGLMLQPSQGGYVKRIMHMVRFQLDVTGSTSEVQGFQEIIKVGLGKHFPAARPVPRSRCYRKGC